MKSEISFRGVGFRGVGVSGFRGFGVSGFRRDLFGWR